MSLLFAATFPERTVALILHGTFAKMEWNGCFGAYLADTPAQLEAKIEQRWAEGFPGLDVWAPTHVEVPSGSRIRVDYADPAAPVLAVRLQELFGLTETPTVGQGRVPLTLHLLAPNQRAVQVTQDLPGFWTRHYPSLRRELGRRYPRHSWPEDPLHAAPPPPRRG